MARRIEQGVSRFIADVKRPVDKRISGEFTKRVAGRFVFTNGAGRDVTVRFCGSNHENSPDEARFIRSNLLDSASSKALLVEQGTPFSTINHFVTNLSLACEGENPRFAAEVPARIQANYHRRLVMFTVDMFVIAEEAQARGFVVQNIDLAFNPNGLRYIFERNGTTDMVRSCYENLQLFLIDPIKGHEMLRIEEGARTERQEYRQFAANVIWKLLEKYNLSDRVAKEGVDDIMNRYSLLFLVHEPADVTFVTDTLTDPYRDDFMAAQLLEQEGDLSLLVHTAHLIGILDRIKGEVKSFTLTATEITEH